MCGPLGSPSRGAMLGVFRLAVPALLLSGVARAQSQLPVAVQHVLEARLPGWRFAVLDRHLAHDLARGLSAAWVAADFDGDGRRDYAVQLVAPSAPPESTQQVVGLLAGSAGYKPVVIMAAGLQTTVYLGREPKGGMVIDLEQYDDRYEPSPTNGGFILEHDGLTVYYAEAAASTCYYVRPRFRCVVSGD
jgi:hypothetical protein